MTIPEYGNMAGMGGNSRDLARSSWDGSGDPNDVEIKIWLQGTAPGISACLTNGTRKCLVEMEKILRDKLSGSVGKTPCVR